MRSAERDRNLSKILRKKQVKGSSSKIGSRKQVRELIEDQQRKLVKEAHRRSTAENR
jgi:cytidylate kinase